MKERLTSNRNLSIHRREQFRSLPVFQSKRGLILEYLDSSLHVVNCALADYPRTTAIRVDLRIPDGAQFVSPHLISSFFASLKAQIKADLDKKRREGTRVHLSKVRYIWAKERDTSIHDHYHVVIFLNGHTYRALGDYKKTSMNMASRIKKAWASALKCPLEDLEGVVHFPNRNTYLVNKHANSFDDELSALFYRISYLTKINTKVFSGDGRSFGCSVS